MKQRATMKLFGWLWLLMLLGCGYTDKHHSKPLCEQTFVDSLEVRVQDSLFSNVLYSRSQIRDALAQAQDSQFYYRLLALYGKTFFVSSTSLFNSLDNSSLSFPIASQIDVASPFFVGSTNI